MAFSDWDSFTGLLDKLAAAESNWSDATDFAAFDANVRQNCAALVPNSGGYDELVASLDESGGYASQDTLFAHLRIVILAVPADEQELGEGWAGYWISVDGDGARIYADSRTAAVSAWAALDTADETDEVDETEPAADTDAPDLRQQHVDDETGRWRRWSDEAGAFEYYHDGAGQWLPYDSPSATWLYENEWVAYEQVGATAAEADEDLAALAEQLVADTLADLDDEIEPLTEEERAEAVAIVLRDLEKEKAQ